MEVIVIKIITIITIFERSIYMIHPSYSELIEAINTNNEDDDESMVLNSRLFPDSCYKQACASADRRCKAVGR